MFRGLSLKAKLLFLCLALSTLVAGVGTVGYLSLKTVSGKYRHITTTNLPHLDDAGEMLASYRRLRIMLNSLGIAGITASEAEQAVKDAQQSIEQYEKVRKSYTETSYAAGMAFGPGEQVLYDKVQHEWEGFKKLSSQVLSLHATGKPEDHELMVKLLLTECAESGKSLAAAMNDLLVHTRKEANVWVGEAQNAEDRANQLVLALIIAGFVLSMTMGFFFANSLSKSIQLVAEGLSNGAEKVGAAAVQISSAADELSASATEQAAALQQTTSSVEQTSAMITKTADNARRSSEVSSVSQNGATKGKEAVQNMILSIEEISQSNNEIMNQIEESNREMTEIVKVIAEIGNKTKVINDIVFQTKLLSFNASVEAARAGEHGKGFAVVAEEVGNLAQMSGNAAKEISDMLDGSSRRVEEIVSNTKTRVEHLIVSGKQKVETGMMTAQRCGEVLDDIVINVSEVGIMVKEISTACQEQSVGVQEITKAMGQLDVVGQQNDRSSQQAAEAAGSLQMLVGELRDMVGQLNQTVQGASAHSITPDISALLETKSPGKVLAFTKKASPAPKKRSVVAAVNSTPLADDPRFEDV